MAKTAKYGPVEGTLPLSLKLEAKGGSASLADTDF